MPRLDDWLVWLDDWIVWLDDWLVWLDDWLLCCLLVNTWICIIFPYLMCFKNPVIIITIPQMAVELLRPQ